MDQGPGDSAKPAPSLALSLLRIPFVLTQEGLLTSEQFVEAAARMGRAVTLVELNDLRQRRLLVPLFRVDDETGPSQNLPQPSSEYSDLRSYAEQGRIRDPWYEDERIWPMFRARRLKDDSRKWDGYLFAHWQLLDLRGMEIARAWAAASSPKIAASSTRNVLLALAALAPRFLPGIMGQSKSNGSFTFDEFDHARRTSTARDRLLKVDVDDVDLLGAAETFLVQAHNDDPMIDWWPLIRHSNHAGWLKLKGQALEALWRRVAAEVLLRGHEDIAAEGARARLPDLTGSNWWSPLHDRINARAAGAPSLERSLGSFHLSPYPRVLLLVEGETEMAHIPFLLEKIGLLKPHLVRVHNLQGSGKNPREIARYVVSPRLGQDIGDRLLTEATPTALVVAMDPENRYRAPELVQTQLTKHQKAVRDEVEMQGATISQEELDVLVHVTTWGTECYEFANFTDDEIADAFTSFAREVAIDDLIDDEWRRGLIDSIAGARREKRDLKVVKKYLGLYPSKPDLARLLMSALQIKFSQEDESPTGFTTPVLALLLKIESLVHQLSGGGYSLSKPS